MATSTLPTILFIHGSWHNPNHFRPIRDLLESQSYPTECPLQPTYNAKPSPPAPAISFDDDVKEIQTTLERLVEEEGKEVIVVMHSYGGVLGSQAVYECYGKKARDAKGQAGGVVQLLYICAFVLKIGESLAGAFGGSLPPFITCSENGLCTMQEPARRFYHDLPQEEQDRWVAELAPVPTATQMMPVSYAAYQHYPVTYLFCTEDQAMPVEVQEMMVEKSGMEFERETCNASHSPFLSQPETILKVIKKIIA